eukprot:8756016-Alexandrium_andersonii.AAC.1
MAQPSGPTGAAFGAAVGPAACCAEGSRFTPPGCPLVGTSVPTHWLSAPRFAAAPSVGGRLLRLGAPHPAAAPP